MNKLKVNILKAIVCVMLIGISAMSFMAYTGLLYLMVIELRI